MEYKIIKSKRKTVALQVNENAELIVRAPIGFSDKKLKHLSMNIYLGLRKSKVK